MSHDYASPPAPELATGPHDRLGRFAHDQRPARERFHLELDEPSRRTSLLRSAVLLLIGALNLGAGPTNPGGRRARIVETATGAEVGALLERLGDAPGGAITEAQADLEQLDVAAFATRWLQP